MHIKESTVQINTYIDIKQINKYFYHNTQAKTIYGKSNKK